MKNKITLILLLVCGCLNAQTYLELIAQADGLYNEKQYVKSVETFKKAFEIQKKSSNTLYNAACAAALANDKTQAFEWLNLSIEKGWTDIEHLKIDTDFDSLHDAPDWTNTLVNLQKKLDILEKDYDKPLVKKLAQIAIDDQKYRLQLDGVREKYGRNSKEHDSLWTIIRSKDSENTIKVCEILDQYGWLGPDKIGAAGNQTLFLVIQHSETAIQQKYLPMMREAVKNKNAKGSSLALLEDRVALREGRKQIYGSQLSTDNATGITTLSPLEDPDHVDERRASVGLQPLADYIKKWKLVWDVEAYKKEMAELDAKKK
jgi:hypothetical protein